MAPPRHPPPPRLLSTYLTLQFSCPLAFPALNSHSEGWLVHTATAAKPPPVPSRLNVAGRLPPPAQRRTSRPRLNILALETTEKTGSLAAARDGRLLAEIALPSDQRSAQSLAPGIQTLLGQLTWAPDDVDLVAVTVGPGSFTGLRIGIATAKAFAYAVGADVLGVDTHETLALVCPAAVNRLSTVIDAQRGQVVTRQFARDAAGALAPQTESELVDVDAWLDGLTPDTYVTGPILRRLVDRLPDGVSSLPNELWHPSAAAVAQLAYQQYTAGRRDDLCQLVPVYSRPSAAEEKRRAQAGG